MKNPGRIGRITTRRGRSRSSRRASTTNAQPADIAAGPDGNLWFTEQKPTRAASGASPRPGVITEFSAGLTTNAPALRHHRRPRRQPLVHRAGEPGPHRAHHPRRGHHRVHDGPHGELRSPTDIAAGADGNLWFTEQREPRRASAASPPPGSSPSSRGPDAATPSPAASPPSPTATSGSPSRPTPAASAGSPSRPGVAATAATGVTHEAATLGATRLAAVAGDDLRRRVRHDGGIRRQTAAASAGRRRGASAVGVAAVRPGPPRARTTSASSRRTRPGPPTGADATFTTAAAPPIAPAPDPPPRRPAAAGPPAPRSAAPAPLPGPIGRVRRRLGHRQRAARPDRRASWPSTATAASLPVGSTIDARDGVLTPDRGPPGRRRADRHLLGRPLQASGQDRADRDDQPPASAGPRPARSGAAGPCVAESFGKRRRRPPQNRLWGKRLARALQHPRREQRRDRPRHEVAHGGALRRHADPRRERPRARPRPAHRSQRCMLTAGHGRTWPAPRLR